MRSNKLRRGSGRTLWANSGHSERASERVFSEPQIGATVNGQVGSRRICTPYAHHFAIIRKILLRMRSWENFVFLEGH